MAKLIFIPEWLNDHLKENDITLDEFYIRPVTSSIVSKVDIINYFKYQCEMHNLLLAGANMNEYNALVENFIHHDFKACPEAVLYMAQRWLKPEDNSIICPRADTSLYTYSVPTVNNTVVYIIGQCLCPKYVTDQKPATSRSILSSFLRTAHTGLRVQNGKIDKTSVLRENPVLGQLYVQGFFKQS